MAAETARAAGRGSGRSGSRTGTHEADALIQRSELKQRRVGRRGGARAGGGSMHPTGSSCARCWSSSRRTTGRRRQTDRRGDLRCRSAMPSSSARTGSASTTSPPTPRAVVPRQGARAPQGLGRRARPATTPRIAVHRGPRRPRAGRSPAARDRRRRRRCDDRGQRRSTTSCVAVLGFRTGEFVLEPRRPGHAGSPRPGLIGRRSAWLVDATAGRRRSRTCSPRTRDTARSTPYVTDDGTEITSVARLLSHLFVRDEAPALRPRARRALGAASPSRSAGPRAATSPSTCSWSASATTRSAAARSTARSTCLAARLARPRRRRQHLVDRGPRRVGQAHRRRLEGPARGRPAVHRDHRQRGRRPPRGRRASTRCRRTRPSRWPSSRCGSSTASCSCSTPRPRPSSGVLPVGAPEYDAGYSLDRLRELALVELATPQSPARHPPLRLARACSSGWSTRAHRRRSVGARRPAQPPRADVQPAARRPVPAARPPRTSTRSASATPRCSRCSRTCC